MNDNYLLNEAKMFLILFVIGSFLLHAGTVVKSEINSKQLNRSWKFTVYLPDSYNVGNERYPVIYLLHGNGDNENSWSKGYHVLDSLIANKIIPPVIAITPSGKRGWWVNSTERFESAVINELVPLIDSTYKTLANRNSRMLFGYSMGGFGALRYGLVYSDLFSACAVLSPALYNEAPPEGSSARTTGSFGTPFNIKQWDSLNYPASIKLFLSKDFKEFFFIGAGDDDWNNPEGQKYNIEYQAVLLYENLHKKLGFPAELRIINGDHSWRVWEPLFIEAIQLMMKYRELIIE